MKNYIANEFGGWATSTGYIKHSFARAIHFGRVYTNGTGGTSGREEDLCEALRCLGQGLHTLEDFGAHTNYTELALRELGFTDVFPHTGVRSEINIRGKRIYPLVTGTFGGVDFLHSVIGEANDHFTQSEVDEMNTALSDAAGLTNSGTKKSGSSGPGHCTVLTDLLGQIPGTGALCQEALALQAASDAQAAQNASYSGSRGYGADPYDTSRASGANAGFAAPPGSVGGPPGPGIPGMDPNMDPQNVVTKIYPILAFRDKVVRAISNIVSKIPGLESLLEKITERVTLFIMGLLAPFIQPIIKAASESLKTGSSTIIDSSGKHQFEPWTDPHCTDPTHSLLSKDHFSNILNDPAGQVAGAILTYVAPRVVYAWDHPEIPVDQILNDVCRVFHHPALRDHNLEIHRNMFSVVERWVHSLPDRGRNLNNILSSESVKAGRNHSSTGGAHGHHHGSSSHSKVAGSAFEMLGRKRDADLGGDPYASGGPGPAASGWNSPPPAAAGFVPGDSHAFPTAYQQGYEVPYQYQGQPPQQYGGQQQQQPYGGQQPQQGGQWYQDQGQPPYQQQPPQPPPPSSGGFGSNW